MKCFVNFAQTLRYGQFIRPNFLHALQRNTMVGSIAETEHQCHRDLYHLSAVVLTPMFLAATVKVDEKCR